MKEDLPLVSVVAVCYNHAKYVIETLDSIKNQTYSNIELIIMDDCSTDNSVDVIQNWIDKTNYSCQFIAHQKNQGLCKTLNEAIELKKGDYAQLISCDDVLDKDKIHLQLESFRKTDESVLLCCSNFSHIDEKSKVLKEQFFNDDFVFPKNTFGAILNGYDGYGVIVHSPSVLIKSSAFNIVGNYNNSLIQEDLHMWLRILIKHKAIYVNKVLVHYRILNTSLSKAEIYRDRMYKDRILVGSLLLKEGVSNEKKKEILKHNKRYLRYFLKEKISDKSYLKFVLGKITFRDYQKISQRSDVDLLINKVLLQKNKSSYVIHRIKKKIKKWI